MKWEDLTGPEFLEAARDPGVCVVSFGVLERHGEHLPVGTDVLMGHRIACLAAEKESAVVFPAFYFGQTHETFCHPGSVTLKSSFLLELIENVIAQIGHNGFTKIILHSAHGGNRFLLPYLVQGSAMNNTPYDIYLYKAGDLPEFTAAVEEIIETEFCHACEYETSLALAVFPKLVKMDRVPAEPAESSGRLDHLKGGYTGLSWYAEYPEHYAGDARKSTAEKGERLLDLHVKTLADFIAAVKSDTELPAVKKEFFARTRKLNAGEA